MYIKEFVILREREPHIGHPIMSLLLDTLFNPLVFSFEDFLGMVAGLGNLFFNFSSPFMLLAILPEIFTNPVFCLRGGNL